MYKDILLTIKQRMPSLPKSEQRIAHYILENPEHTVTLSVSDLAELSQASPASIIRLTRSLGIEGYTELKLLLSRNLQSVSSELYTDIQPDESIEQISRKLLVNTQHYLNETAELIEINTKTIDQITDILIDAPTIYVYGIGASHLIANDLKQKFTRVGKHVIVTLDQHELTASLSIADPKSVYIGVSNSGSNTEGKVMMELASELGLVTISMTQESNNHLRQLAQYSLLTSIVNEAPIRTGATLSLLNQMYLVDVIFYRYFTKNYDVNMKRIGKTRETIEKLEEKYRK